MIYGNLKALGASYEYPRNIYEVLTYLQQQDFDTMPFGAVEYDDNGTRILYMEIPHANIDETVCEIHQDYLDIQVSVDGHEVYGFAPNFQTNPVVDNRLETDDICLFSAMNQEVRIHAKPLDFFIFFPNDVHHGCNLMTDKPARRVVVKMPVSVL
ncbi:MAG: YhcH/YjgK/YiaL family protein [Aerococcaceae bacterium]|nr:YhcH/YjgK/YiaL family protein [Aerococcaceae bacterium]